MTKRSSNHIFEALVGLVVVGFIIALILGLGYTLKVKTEQYEQANQDLCVEQSTMLEGVAADDCFGD